MIDGPPRVAGLMRSALLAAGEAALATAEAGGAGHGPITVVAEVLPDNPASRQLFVAAGYRAASSASAASEHVFAKTLAAPAIPPARTPECSP